LRREYPDLHVELREKPAPTRGPFGQEPVWELLIGAVVGGAAKAAVEALIRAVRESRMFKAVRKVPATRKRATAPRKARSRRK
jgi:hypothetical protein